MRRTRPVTRFPSRTKTSRELSILLQHSRVAWPCELRAVVLNRPHFLVPTPRRAMLPDELQVLLLALVTRLSTWTSLLVLPRYVLAFDQSAGEVLSSEDLWLQGLLRWDALHFERIARNGYTLEQEFAFMPALPWIMRLLGSGFGLLSYSSGRAILWTSMLALICSVLSVVIFHRCFFIDLSCRHSSRLS